MKLIYLKPALICDSFDVAIGIKIPFFRVLVTIDPGRSLLQFVTTNCLIEFQERLVVLNGLNFSGDNLPTTSIMHLNNNFPAHEVFSSLGNKKRNFYFN